MDSLIIAISITTFLIFLLIHLVVLRRINQKAIIKWIIYIYVLAFLFSLFAFILICGSCRSSLPDKCSKPIFCALAGMPSLASPATITFVLTLGLSLVLYTLMSAVFVMALLGIMMTSVRIRLLNLIRKDGKSRGITKSQILKQYNKKVIIKNRLSRLLASGDLRKSDGYYSLGRRFSYFYFHNWITSLFRRLYN